MRKTVNPYFVSFYNFMKSKGFDIDVAVCDFTNDPPCMIFFKTSVFNLWQFLQLPNVKHAIKTGVEAQDGSYTIYPYKNRKNECVLSLCKDYHINILSYIMANR